VKKLSKFLNFYATKISNTRLKQLTFFLNATLRQAQSPNNYFAARPTIGTGALDKRAFAALQKTYNKLNAASCRPVITTAIN
jgi:hypothetical protein